MDYTGKCIANAQKQLPDEADVSQPEYSPPYAPRAARKPLFMTYHYKQ